MVIHDSLNLLHPLPTLVTLIPFLFFLIHYQDFVPLLLPELQPKLSLPEGEGQVVEFEMESIDEGVGLAGSGKAEAPLRESDVALKSEEEGYFDAKVLQVQLFSHLLEKSWLADPS